MANRTDNFNRANSTAALGTPSDGGSDWVAAAGTWGITSNKSYKVAPGGSFQAAYLEASTSTADVQATNTGPGNTGLCCRLSDNSNFIFGQIVAGGVALWKGVAGTFTQIGATYTGSIAAGDVWKLTCDASNNLKLYQNGVLRVSATDAAGSSNTKHGYCDYTSGSSVNWDDFSITDTAGGGARTLTTSLAAAIQAAQSATASMSAGVQAARTNTATTDAAVQAAQSAQASLNAAVLKLSQAAASLDAALRKANTATASVSAQVQSGTSVSVAADAAVRASASTAASIDAAIARSPSVGASLAAAIAVQRVLSAAFDGAVLERRWATAAMGAYVYDGTVAGPQSPSRLRIGVAAVLAAARRVGGTKP